MKERRTIRKTLIAAAVMTFAIVMGCMQASAAISFEYYQKKAASIAKKTGTELVKTIRYKAALKANVKVTVKETGKKIKMKAGTTVTVSQRDYHEEKGVSQCVLSDGNHFYVANRYLRFTESITTGADGDYSKKTKLAYINGQRIASDTDYLLWISLDKQRVTLFKGKSKNWKYVKCWKCSSGAFDTPTFDQTFVRKYTVKWKKIEVNGLWLYTAFYGSGIHKWPGSGMSENIGKNPVSHSCVRVKVNAARYIYNKIPLKTRVWIW